MEFPAHKSGQSTTSWPFSSTWESIFAIVGCFLCLLFYMITNIFDKSFCSIKNLFPRFEFVVLIAPPFTHKTVFSVVSLIKTRFWALSFQSCLWFFISSVLLIENRGIWRWHTFYWVSTEAGFQHDSWILFIFRLIESQLDSIPF